MEPVRQPAVAGTFYPDEPEVLRAQLRRLLEEAPRAPALAGVVPHAGWMYSGPVAGAVYSRLDLPSRAILLGPNHTGLGTAASIMSVGRWRYPGGEVAIDGRLAEALRREVPRLQEDYLAHLREHALEVQLPFLHYLRADLEIVPITLMRTDLGFCREVGEGVARAVRAAEGPVLLLASTDLNHYEPQEVSNRKDRQAIDAILALDPEGLDRAVREHDISMCGIAPTLATLYAVRALGAHEARLIRYQTSGDVSGDFRRVVGYAGVVIT